MKMIGFYNLAFVKFLFLFILFSYPLTSAQSYAIETAFNTYKKNLHIWEAPDSFHPVNDSTVTLLGRWAWGPCITLDAQNGYAFIGNGPTFQIIDISQPSSPRIVGEYLTNGFINQLLVKGNTAYVCIGSGFLMLDISNPSNPGKISFIEISGMATNFALSGSFAYIATFSGYIRVLDISDLHNPYFRGIIPKYSELTSSMTAKDGYIYVGSPELNYLQIINATNPDSLISTGFDTNGRVISLFIKDTLLFSGVSWSTTHFKIYNISNLTEPVFIGQVEIVDSVLIDGITVSDDGMTAYALNLSSGEALLHNEGIYSIDLSNLNNPVILDKFVKNTQGSSFGISISQNTLIASYFSGVCFLDISDPDTLRLESFFAIGGLAQKIKIKDSLAFVASGLSGLWIIDISDPTKPKAVSNVQMNSFTSDLVVDDSLVYIVNFPAFASITADDPLRGLWIINVTNVHNPVILSHYIGIVHFPSGFFTSNSIEKSGNMVFITQSGGVSNDSSLEIINVSNPLSPERVGIFRINYTPYDIAINDTTAYLATADGGIIIISISNPANPIEISNILNTSFGVLYNKPYLYSSTSVFSIIDVNNPFEPFLISSIITHNSSENMDLALCDKFIYWADYELGMIDISDPFNPVQITTYFGKDNVSGVAASGNKIYFTDNTHGVWILRNNLITDIKETVKHNSPDDCTLNQNYPNPFNSSTTIEFEIRDREKVTIEVFDILGKRICTLLNKEVNAGKYNISFNTRDLSSGIYLYRMTSEFKSFVKKMVLLK